MSELSIAVQVLQSMLPYFFLFLFPLRERLHYCNRVNIPIMALYLCGSIFILIHLLQEKPVSQLNLFAVSLIFMGAAALICLVFLKGRMIINIFYLFVIKNYSDIVVLIAETNKPFAFLYRDSFPVDALCFEKVLLTLLTFPLIYLFVGKLLQPIVRETEEHPFWKQMWYIPLLFFVGFYLLVSKHVSALYDVFPLFPEVWVVVTFLTYYLILYMLREAVHVRKLEELLSRTEFQAQIQADQYRDLLAGIEAVRMQNHDMRHILLALKGYMQKNDLEGFRRYIEKYREEHPAQPAAEDDAAAGRQNDGEDGMMTEAGEVPGGMGEDRPAEKSSGMEKDSGGSDKEGCAESCPPASSPCADGENRSGKEEDRGTAAFTRE